MYYVSDKDVIEKDTGLVIESYDTHQKANEVCRDLNLGAGFQGWTPSFFCQPFAQKAKRR